MKKVLNPKEIVAIQPQPSTLLNHGHGHAPAPSADSVRRIKG